MFIELLFINGKYFFRMQSFKYLKLVQTDIYYTLVKLYKLTEEPVTKPSMAQKVSEPTKLYV